MSTETYRTRSFSASVERMLQSLFDRLVQCHPVIAGRRLAGKLTGGASLVNPAPDEVVAAVVRKALDGVVSWGGARDLQCPAWFTVSVPQLAWKVYYGNGTQQICRRIEQVAGEKIRRKLGCSAEIHVSIAPTHALLDGELIVEAAYYERSVELLPDEPGVQEAVQTARMPEQVVCDAADGGAQAADEHPSSVQNADVPVDADVCDARVAEERDCGAAEAAAQDQATSAASEAGEDCTPRTDAPQIVLAYGSERYVVFDGATVGVARGDVNDRADIVLPYSRDFYWVSKKHGRFTYDAASGQWLFEQLGSNGSAVVRNGEAISLKRGESLELRDGDGLVFARAHRQISVLDSRAERTAYQPAA